MITSRSGDKHRQRAFELGVQRYLGKPYQELDLMRNVYDLLGIARARGDAHPLLTVALLAVPARHATACAKHSAMPGPAWSWRTTPTRSTCRSCVMPIPVRS